jgi:hypothetical protein
VQPKLPVLAFAVDLPSLVVTKGEARALDRTATLARRRGGITAASVSVLSKLPPLEHARGRWKQALIEQEEVVAAMDGDISDFAIRMRIRLAYYQLCQDRLDQAQDLIASLEADADAYTDSTHSDLHRIQALALTYVGDHTGACDRIRASLERSEQGESEAGILSSLLVAAAIDILAERPEAALPMLTLASQASVRLFGVRGALSSLLIESLRALALAGLSRPREGAQSLRSLMPTTSTTAAAGAIESVGSLALLEIVNETPEYNGHTSLKPLVQRCLAHYRQSTVVAKLALLTYGTATLFETIEHDKVEQQLCAVDETFCDTAPEMWDLRPQLNRWIAARWADLRSHQGRREEAARIAAAVAAAAARCSGEASPETLRDVTESTAFACDAGRSAGARDSLASVLDRLDESEISPSVRLHVVSRCLFIAAFLAGIDGRSPLAELIGRCEAIAAQLCGPDGEEDEAYARLNRGEVEWEKASIARVLISGDRNEAETRLESFLTRLDEIYGKNSRTSGNVRASFWILRSLLATN